MRKCTNIQVCCYWWQVTGSLDGDEGWGARWATYLDSTVNWSTRCSSDENLHTTIKDKVQHWWAMGKGHVGRDLHATIEMKDESTLMKICMPLQKWRSSEGLTKISIPLWRWRMRGGALAEVCMLSWKWTRKDRCVDEDLHATTEVKDRGSVDADLGENLHAAVEMKDEGWCIGRGLHVCIPPR